MVASHRTKGEKTTILTVNYNTSDFIGLLLDSLRLLTREPYRVIICDNGSKSKDLKNLKDLCKNEENIDLIINQQSTKGSIGHGEALDILASRVETPFFVVADSDVVFLRKDWDTELIGRINEEIKAVGTEAAGDKPKDFPTLYVVLYETESFRKVDRSFLPDVGAYKKGAYTDTGWQVREGFLDGGISGETLEMRNTRVYKDGPFRDFTGVGEFYLKGQEEIFLVHYGRGATGGVAKFLHSEGSPTVPGRIRALYGANKERKAWLKQAQQYLESISASSIG